MITIDTDANLLKVVFSEWFFIKSEESYNLNEVRSTLHNVAGARGAQLRELKIDVSGKQIFSLRASQNGWSLKKMEQIFSALNHGA